MTAALTAEQTAAIATYNAEMETIIAALTELAADESLRNGFVLSNGDGTLTVGPIQPGPMRPNVEAGAYGYEFKLRPTVYTLVEASRYAGRWNRSQSEQDRIAVISVAEYCARRIKTSRDLIASMEAMGQQAAERG